MRELQERFERQERMLQRERVVATPVNDAADWNAKALPLRKFLARYNLEFSDQPLLGRLKAGTSVPTDAICAKLLADNPHFAFYKDDFFLL